MTLPAGRSSNPCPPAAASGTGAPSMQTRARKGAVLGMIFTGKDPEAPTTGTVGNTKGQGDGVSC